MIETASENGGTLKEPASLLEGCGALFILAKPGIVAAVALSGFTGMVMAGKGLPETRTGLACLASLLLMAAGSALANSVLDRHMDRRMERLTLRSHALNTVGTVAAITAAITLTSCAVLIALALLSSKAALLLIAAALFYTIYYTLFLKRRTPWAAVLGGLPGALPVLIGQCAVTERLDPGSLTLFLIMLIWQPPHFWLLSLSHQREYRAAEVPILPLVQGDRIYLGVGALIPASLLLRFGGPCSTGCAACAALFGCSYLLGCRYFICNGDNYSAAFKGSIAYVLSLFALIVVDICPW